MLTDFAKRQQAAERMLADYKKHAFRLATEGKNPAEAADIVVWKYGCTRAYIEDLVDARREPAPPLTVYCVAERATA